MNGCACSLVTIGSNIQPEEHIPAAIDCITREIACPVSVGRAWSTEAQSVDGGRFINLAMVLDTHVDDAAFKDLESRLGRSAASGKHSSRKIDIDLQFRGVCWPEQRTASIDQEVRADWRTAPYAIMPVRDVLDTVWAEGKPRSLAHLSRSPMLETMVRGVAPLSRELELDRHRVRLTELASIACAELARAENRMDVPVAAAIGHSRGCLAAVSQVGALERPTAHSEVLVLEEAAARWGRKCLRDATVFCTHEPCSMCMEILANCGIAVIGWAIDRWEAPAFYVPNPGSAMFSHALNRCIIWRGVAYTVVSDTIREVLRIRGRSVGSPAPMWIEPLEYSQFYDRVAGEYDDPTHHAVSAAAADHARSILQRVLHDTAAGTVLDLGCATSDPIDNSRVVGIDVSETMLAIRAKRYPGSCGLVARIEDLPFDDATVVGATASLVLDHCPDLPLALTEIARVVIPGGSVFISCLGTTDLPDWKYADDVMRYCTTQGHWVGVPIALRTPEQICAACEAAGILVLGVEKALLPQGYSLHIIIGSRIRSS